MPDPSGSFVRDDNRPYLKFLDAMLVFEELQVKVGIGVRFRYPNAYRKGRPASTQPRPARGTARGNIGARASVKKDRDRVARVGHVWNLRSGWMVDSWDRLQGKMEAETSKLHEQAIKGHDPVAGAKRIGEMYQNAFRKAIQSFGLTYSGKLSESIGVYVTDEREKARRKAALLKRRAQGK